MNNSIRSLYVRCTVGKGALIYPSDALYHASRDSIKDPQQSILSNNQLNVL